MVNVRGNTRDPLRGSYCTPKWFADLLPTFDVDPFSNPRSHVRAAARCMLEDGGDGFGNGKAGTFVCGAPIASPEMPGAIERLGNGLYRATASALVWIQPDYQHVLRVIQHYTHTRWIALLRFDPRPEWFDAVYDPAEIVGVIRGTPTGRVFNFESPPGVPSSSNSFPHAIYARRADDVPRALLPYLIAWRKRPS